MIKVKKGFSLIEVIFVLVILGIVASISSQIIIQVYENYITQNALYKTSTKTEMAINQIVNRLTFSIGGTTITKDPLTVNPYTKASEGNNWRRLQDIDITVAGFRRFTTIEWIGYDNDSFSAADVPYWSGVANYEEASSGSFETPGSTLSNTATIMNNLSHGKVDLTNSNPAAIIFTQKEKKYRIGRDYDPACMGLINENNTSCIFPVRRGNLIATNDTNLTFTRNSDGSNINLLPKIVTERYKLAWSAYALVPERIIKNGVATDLFNLFLYSNYQPWNNETYTQYPANQINKSLLISNVSVFKFTENGGIIQVKLCSTENIGQDFNISSCKEKAIIR